MLIKEKAAADAADVLGSYWTLGVPVDPERIAVAMGMTVTRTSFASSDVSGILRVEPEDTPQIYIDRSDVLQRQRFTIAHEIGHYVERTTNGADDFNFIDRRGTDASTYDAHEFYADEFAGNLLMPEADVVHHFKEFEGSLVRLAARYGVSLPAMRVRLRRLNLG